MNEFGFRKINLSKASMHGTLHNGINVAVCLSIFPFLSRGKFIWFGIEQFWSLELIVCVLWCSTPFPWIQKLFHVWFKSLWFKPPWSLRKTKFNVRIINYLANRFFAYLLTWSYRSKLEWPSNCWFFGCQFFFIVPLIIYFWFNMLII